MQAQAQNKSAQHGPPLTPHPHPPSGHRLPMGEGRCRPRQRRHQSAATSPSRNSRYATTNACTSSAENNNFNTGDTS